MSDNQMRMLSSSIIVLAGGNAVGFGANNLVVDAWVFVPRPTLRRRLDSLDNLEKDQ